MSQATTNHLTKIILYGILGRKFGRVHYLAVESAAEAVRALGALLPGFHAFLTQSKDKHGLGYSVFYGKHNLKEEELRFNNGGSDIRIAPILLGRKNGGWVSVILGAILVIVGVLLIWTPVGAPLISAGVGLIVAGVVQRLPGRL